MIGKILLLSLLVMTGSALAHHSYAAFQMDKEVTIEGTVVSYTLVNPHVHLTVRVPPGKDPSQAGLWDVEGAAANIMRRQGWNAHTYKVGDPIKAVGHPLKTGDKGIALFYAIKPDGSRLYMDISRPKNETK